MMIPPKKMQERTTPHAQSVALGIVKAWHRRRSRSGWSGFGRTTFIQGKNKISFLQKASNKQKC